ncbi:hypothetical protein PTTG_25373 [Puccinia triticina 1-1 BBBD Race 1]|uniref:Uncharacterized protein n=1 Tax=Puccinia triticina (isolate 1-1 / race 1 (BBBD)) TaxID=630390 RepID=A0A180H431_PUCT1|nr:hypothetical protein PTTG_25373 [Puccinia triticina 1-1 BBBD Race 1]
MKKLIQKQAKDDSNQVLLIRPGKLEAFKSYFAVMWKETQTKHNKRGPKHDRYTTPSIMASLELKVLNTHMDSWRQVYENRLGIDFTQLEQRIKKILADSPSPRLAALGERSKVMKFLTRYLVFVDMIITILPQPTATILKRPETFRTALNCFENNTEELLHGKKFKMSTLRKITPIWQYVTYWLSKDPNYSKANIVEGGKLSPRGRYKNLEINADLKTFFGLVFAHSIKTLTERNPKLSEPFPAEPIEVKLEDS